ncbi:MAG: NAD(P)/FAD-dependent oxidoreductase [Sedimentisphaerales bacterium]|nr:NAD(P)/FAD-dependent oxidoreductase [Sedimentisphaerales bacterium]
MEQPTAINTDVLILGGGPAGLMCASQAAEKGRSVIVLDRSSKLGTKLLISGGGKCNFTNRHCSADNYISSNPHFVKSALAQFSNADFIDMIEQHNIGYEEREFGRLFCRHSARDLLDMLIKQCNRHNVEFLLQVEVKSIENFHGFVVHTNKGDITARALVVATGGLTWPQIGATDLGYRIARQLGHRVVACRPGLVPLRYDEDDLQAWGNLTGITVEAVVRCKKQSFRENILFTHNGLSGPAILQISSYYKEGDQIEINWLPDLDVYQFLLGQKQYNGSAMIKRVLAPYLPNRILQQWSQSYFPTKTLAECSLEQIQQASDSLNRQPFRPRTTEGFNKAEVTVGGVSTEDISSKTMQSRIIADLYFVGEVLDVTGQLGGYNLQWAWSSGAAAGRAL